MKPLLLLLAGLLAARAGRAQLFYVYHVSGPAYLQAQPRPVPLLPHAAVQRGQTLLLRRGAQVILLDQAGHNMAYTKPGATSYDDLEKAFAASAAGPGRAYLAFVWQRLHHHETESAHQGSAPLGGVARGNPVRLLAPADSAVLAGPVLTFEWQAAPVAAPVWFTLLENNSPVLQLRLAASSLELNAQLTHLRPSTLYQWSVSADAEVAGNTPRRAFVLADEEARRALAQELAGLPAPPDPAWQPAFEKQWFFARAAWQAH